MYKVRSDILHEDKNSMKTVTRTSSTAHLTSLASILYIGGTTCTGMLMRRSENTNPT
jgi:hypothetical protein